eukprot:11316437-Alexandrium_andersonii.AAC.1
MASPPRRVTGRGAACGEGRPRPGLRGTAPLVVGKVSRALASPKLGAPSEEGSLEVDGARGAAAPEPPDVIPS